MTTTEAKQFRNDDCENDCPNNKTKPHPTVDRRDKPTKSRIKTRNLTNASIVSPLAPSPGSRCRVSGSESKVRLDPPAHSAVVNGQKKNDHSFEVGLDVAAPQPEANIDNSNNSPTTFRYFTISSSNSKSDITADSQIGLEEFDVEIELSRLETFMNLLDGKEYCRTKAARIEDQYPSFEIQTKTQECVPHPANVLMRGPNHSNLGSQSQQPSAQNEVTLVSKSDLSTARCLVKLQPEHSADLSPDDKNSVHASPQLEATSTSPQVTSITSLTSESSRCGVKPPCSLRKSTYEQSDIPPCHPSTPLEPNTSIRRRLVSLLKVGQPLDAERNNRNQCVDNSRKAGAENTISISNGINDTYERELYSPLRSRSWGYDGGMERSHFQRGNEEAGLPSMIPSLRSRSVDSSDMTKRAIAIARKLNDDKSSKMKKQNVVTKGDIVRPRANTIRLPIIPKSKHDNNSLADAGRAQGNVNLGHLVPPTDNDRAVQGEKVPVGDHSATRSSIESELKPLHLMTNPKERTKNVHASSVCDTSHSFCESGARQLNDGTACRSPLEVPSGRLNDGVSSTSGSCDRPKSDVQCCSSPTIMLSKGETSDSQIGDIVTLTEELSSIAASNTSDQIKNCSSSSISSSHPPDLKKIVSQLKSYLHFAIGSYEEERQKSAALNEGDKYCPSDTSSVDSAKSGAGSEVSGAFVAHVDSETKTKLTLLEDTISNLEALMELRNTPLATTSDKLHLQKEQYVKELRESINKIIMDYDESHSPGIRKSRREFVNAEDRFNSALKKNRSPRPFSFDSKESGAKANPPLKGILRNKHASALDQQNKLSSKDKHSGRRITFSPSSLSSQNDGKHYFTEIEAPSMNSPNLSISSSLTDDAWSDSPENSLDSGGNVAPGSTPMLEEMTTGDKVSCGPFCGRGLFGMMSDIAQDFRPDHSETVQAEGKTDSSGYFSGWETVNQGSPGPNLFV